MHKETDSLIYSCSKPNIKKSSSIQAEFQIQTDRINKILDEAIYKLRMVVQLPSLWEHDGQMLREHLDSKDAEYILYVCRDFMSRRSTSDNVALDTITNITDMLDKISVYSTRKNKRSSVSSVENYEAHVSYAVDAIWKSQSLVEHVQTIQAEIDPLASSFIDAMQKLKTIVQDKLNQTAEEEMQMENDLKTAYRSSMLLSENIKELEDLLDKQRDELGNEHDTKHSMMVSLAEKIESMRERAKTDINQIVYDSETKMMKDYLKSAEKQETLSVDAKMAVQQYEHLLEQHLHEEKAARAKRLKAESQLASWLTKYDTDIGDKQIEYETLEHEYLREKEILDDLQEQLDEQEIEHTALMEEKADEERRIYEEKAFLFLLNRSARRIQRCWRAYIARKKARRRGRKGKKGAVPFKKVQPRATRAEGDPNALIDSAFNAELLADIQTDADAFHKKDVVVEL